MIDGRGIEGAYRKDKNGGTVCLCVFLYVCFRVRIVALSVCLHVYFSVFLSVYACVSFE